MYGSCHSIPEHVPGHYACVARMLLDRVHQIEPLAMGSYLLSAPPQHAHLLVRHQCPDLLLPPLVCVAKPSARHELFRVVWPTTNHHSVSTQTLPDLSGAKKNLYIIQRKAVPVLLLTASDDNLLPLPSFCIASSQCRPSNPPCHRPSLANSLYRASTDPSIDQRSRPRNLTFCDKVAWPERV